MEQLINNTQLSQNIFDYIEDIIVWPFLDMNRYHYTIIFCLFLMGIIIDLYHKYKKQTNLFYIGIVIGMIIYLLLYIDILKSYILMLRAVEETYLSDLNVDIMELIKSNNSQLLLETIIFFTMNIYTMHKLYFFNEKNKYYLTPYLMLFALFYVIIPFFIHNSNISIINYLYYKQLNDQFQELLGNPLIDKYIIFSYLNVYILYIFSFVIFYIFIKEEVQNEKNNNTI